MKAKLFMGKMIAGSLMVLGMAADASADHVHGASSHRIGAYAPQFPGPVRWAGDGESCGCQVCQTPVLRVPYYQQAMREFNIAIKQAPKAFAAYRERAWLRFRFGNYQGVIDDDNQTLSLKPKDPGSHRLLAWLYASCGDEQFRGGALALNHAESAFKTTGWDSCTSLEVLADAHAEADNFDKAVFYHSIRKRHWLVSCMTKVKSATVEKGFVATVKPVPIHERFPLPMACLKLGVHVLTIGVVVILLLRVLIRIMNRCTI